MREPIDANTTPLRPAERPDGRSEPADAQAWEDVVREAFAGIRAPEDAKAATLDAIETLRAQQGAAAGPALRASALSPRRKPTFKIIRRALAAAAGVVAVAAGVVGFRMLNEPAAYIGVDVNPSLELTVNAFGTVLDARALNDDAEAVLEGVPVKGLAYEDALADILEGEGMSACVDESSYIEVSVTSDDDALAESLRQASDACLGELPCEGSCSRVDSQTREAAHHAGMGAGKYAEAQKLIGLDPSVTLDECSDMTMREIRDRIHACSGEDAQGQGAQGEGVQNSASAGEGARHGEGAGHRHEASQDANRHAQRQTQDE